MPGALLAPPSGAVLAGAPYRLANGGACRERPRSSGTRASRVLGAKGAVSVPKQDALRAIEPSREEFQNASLFPPPLIGVGWHHESSPCRTRSRTVSHGRNGS